MQGPLYWGIMTTIGCAVPEWLAAQIAVPVPVCMAVYLFVRSFVCLSVCPLAHVKNHTPKFHPIYCTCYLWPWLGPPLTATQHVTYFRFYE